MFQSLKALHCCQEPCKELWHLYLFVMFQLLYASFCTKLPPPLPCSPNISSLNSLQLHEFPVLMAVILSCCKLKHSRSFDAKKVYMNIVRNVMYTISKCNSTLRTFRLQTLIIIPSLLLHPRRNLLNILVPHTLVVHEWDLIFLIIFLSYFELSEAIQSPNQFPVGGRDFISIQYKCQFSDIL